MGKKVAIADGVYRRLKREKGDRSFSEVIVDRLDSGGRLADVSGQGVLKPEAYATARDEIARLSEGKTERLDDESP